MAQFYSVEVRFKDGSSGEARGIGNNAAWLCRCKEVLVGPHEDMYLMPACPRCERKFRIMRGTKPRYVSLVKEV